MSKQLYVFLLLCLYPSIIEAATSSESLILSEGDNTYTSTIRFPGVFENQAYSRDVYMKMSGFPGTRWSFLYGLTYLEVVENRTIQFSYLTIATGEYITVNTTGNVDNYWANYMITYNGQDQYVIYQNASKIAIVIAYQQDTTNNIDSTFTHLVYHFTHSATTYDGVLAFRNLRLWKSMLSESEVTEAVSVNIISSTLEGKLCNCYNLDKLVDYQFFDSGPCRMHVYQSIYETTTTHIKFGDNGLLPVTLYDNTAPTACVKPTTTSLSFSINKIPQLSAYSMGFWMLLEDVTQDSILIKGERSGNCLSDAEFKITTSVIALQSYYLNTQRNSVNVMTMTGKDQLWFYYTFIKGRPHDNQHITVYDLDYDNVSAAITEKVEDNFVFCNKIYFMNANSKPHFKQFSIFRNPLIGHTQRSYHLTNGYYHPDLILYFPMTERPGMPIKNEAPYGISTTAIPSSFSTSTTVTVEKVVNSCAQGYYYQPAGSDAACKRRTKNLHYIDKYVPTALHTRGQLNELHSYEFSFLMWYKRGNVAGSTYHWVSRFDYDSNPTQYYWILDHTSIRAQLSIKYSGSSNVENIVLSTGNTYTDETWKFMGISMMQNPGYLSFIFDTTFSISHPLTEDSDDFERLYYYNTSAQTAFDLYISQEAIFRTYMNINEMYSYKQRILSGSEVGLYFYRHFSEDSLTKYDDTAIVSCNYGETKLYGFTCVENPQFVVRKLFLKTSYLKITSDFTFEIIFKVIKGTTQNITLIKMDNFFELYLTSDSKIRAVIYSKSGAKKADFTTSTTATGNSHIVVTTTGSKAYIYINTSPTVVSISNTEAMAQNSYFVEMDAKGGKFIVREVRAWNRYMYDDEVADVLFRSVTPALYKSLRLYYRMDVVEDKLYDISHTLELGMQNELSTRLGTSTTNVHYWDFFTPRMRVCGDHYRYSSSANACFFSETALQTSKKTVTTQISQIEIKDLDTLTEYTVEFWIYRYESNAQIKLDSQRWDITHSTFTPQNPSETAKTFSNTAVYGVWCYQAYGNKINDKYYIYKIGCDDDYGEWASQASFSTISSNITMKMTYQGGDSGAQINSLSFWKRKNTQQQVKEHAWKWDLSGNSIQNGGYLTGYYPLHYDFSDKLGRSTNFAPTPVGSYFPHLFSMYPRVYQAYYESNAFSPSSPGRPYAPKWTATDLLTSTNSQIRNIEIRDRDIYINIDKIFTLTAISEDTNFNCSDFVHSSSLSSLGEDPSCSYYNTTNVLDSRNIIKITVGNNHTLNRGSLLLFKETLISPYLTFSNLGFVAYEEPMYCTTNYGMDFIVAQYDPVIFSCVVVNLVSAQNTISYTWEQLSGPTIPLNTTTSNQKYSPYQLPAGTIVLRATFLSKNSKDITMKVYSRPKARLVFKAQNVYLTDNVTLNGSKSLDMDDSTTRNPLQLAYYWECFQSKNLLNFCTSAMITWGDAVRNGSILDLPGGTFESEGIYYFKLTVEKNISVDYTVAQIIVNSGEGIKLGISPISETLKISGDIESMFKVYLPNEKTYNISWSLSPTVAELYPQYDYLRIPADQLIKSTEYTLTAVVNATDSSLTGTINYIFSVSLGVAAGNISISPDQGEGFTRNFEITPNNWTDNEGGTLQYRFGYNSLGDEEVRYVSEWAYHTAFNTKLVPGNENYEYKVEIWVFAKNTYGDLANSSTTIIVTKPVFTGNNTASTFVNTQLELAFNDKPSTQAQTIADLAYFVKENKLSTQNDLCGGCNTQYGSCDIATKICTCNEGYNTTWDCSLNNSRTDEIRNISLQLLTNIESLQKKIDDDSEYEGNLPQSLIEAFYEVNLNYPSLSQELMDISKNHYTKFIEKTFQIMSTDLLKEDDFEFAQRVKFTAESKKKTYEIVGNYMQSLRYNFTQNGSVSSTVNKEKSKEIVDLVTKLAVLTIADSKLTDSTFTLTNDMFGVVAGKSQTSDLYAKTLSTGSGSLLILPSTGLGHNATVSNYFFQVWNENPHYGHSNRNSVPGKSLVFHLFDQYKSSPTIVSNLTSKATFIFMVENNIEVVNCTSMNESTGEYSSVGLVTVNITNTSSGTGRTIFCTSDHFSQFFPSTELFGISTNTTNSTNTTSKDSDSDDYEGFWYNLYNWGSLSDYDYQSSALFWVSLILTMLFLILAWVCYTQEVGEERLRYRLQLETGKGFEAEGDSPTFRGSDDIFSSKRGGKKSKGKGKGRGGNKIFHDDGPFHQKEEVDTFHQEEYIPGSKKEVGNFTQFLLYFMGTHSILRMIPKLIEDAVRRSARILIFVVEALVLTFFSGIFFDSKTGEGANGDVSGLGKLMIALIGIFVSAPILWINIRLLAKHNIHQSMDLQDQIAFERKQTWRRTVGVVITVVEVTLLLCYINILGASFESDAQDEWLVTWAITICVDYLFIQPIKILLLFLCSQEKTMGFMFSLLSGGSQRA